jgi:hypothetical protein
MKTILTIASVLTWFNLIFWGATITFGVLGMLVMGQATIFAAGFVLLASIPLNCFAALKLQTSIRHPNIPLSHQTPAGIRFVGLMALFFGFLMLFKGAAALADPKPAVEVYKQMLDQMPKPLPEGAAGLGMVFAHCLAVGMLALGLLVAVNVVLNLRLLRWYYLVRKSDAS